MSVADIRRALLISNLFPPPGGIRVGRILLRTRRPPANLSRSCS